MLFFLITSKNFIFLKKLIIFLIKGTGTNAAYIENRDNVENLKKNCESQVVINTEWGAFGECGELDKWRTVYDKIVDEESLYPGKQLFVYIYLCLCVLLKFKP